ncbi:FtsQ-type POTRA domain-containing protein [Candidatus Curtissbacteria bacterium]|nr:FtsQ-type POTRA domain-containing protein [Candidatus Curtissbacteria bacterium]
MAKVLPVLVIIILVSIFFSPLLKIKEVVTNQSQQCIPNQNLLNDLNLGNQNILLIDQKTLEAQIKNQYSCVDKVSLKREFPAKIVLDITVKKPVVKIEASNLSLTEDGQIVQNDNQNLPTLYLPQNLKLQLGQKITDEIIVFALKLAMPLMKSDYNVQNIRIISNEDLAAYNQQGTIAIFSSKKSPDEQVDSLQQVLIVSKINSSKIAKIDLRFDKPVVEYKEFQ